MSRSYHSGPERAPEDPSKGARNVKGKESEQSKERRKKKKYQERSSEEVAEEMNKNKGRYVGTELTGK